MSQSNVGADSPLAVHRTAGDTDSRLYSTNKPNGRRYAAPRRRDAEGKLTTRRYGPSATDQQEDLENNAGNAMSIRGHHDLKAMDETALRQFAIQGFGRRFAEGETIDHMRGEIQREMDVGSRARYA